MNEKQFPAWEYSAVLELEALSRSLPILPRRRAEAFSAAAGAETGQKADVVERHSGSLFEGMKGFVGASDRKDFLARWEDANPDSLGHGILLVETFDRVIGVTYCVSRVAENDFLTYGWIGDKERLAIQAASARSYSGPVVELASPPEAVPQSRPPEQGTPKTPFRSYFVLREMFSKQGRMPRPVYLAFFGTFLLVIALIILILSQEDPPGLLILAALLLEVFAFIVFIVAAVKRCHDRNHSGLYLFLYIFPFVNLWLLIELAALPGTRGPNHYGPDPRGFKPAIPAHRKIVAAPAPGPVPAGALPARNILRCKQCGGLMQETSDHVFYFGEGPNPIVKLRCEKCNITRFEKRVDVEAARLAL